MPYLSWLEGSKPHRHRVVGACVMGSDAERCNLLNPKDGPGTQAVLQWEGNHWHLRPLEGFIIRKEGEMVPSTGIRMEDGDTFSLGGWTLRYSTGFPGLDQERFLETAGSLPLPSGPAAAAPLRWIAGMAQRLEQGLLKQEDPTLMAHRLLDEAASFLSAESGLHLRQNPNAPWRVEHTVGVPQEDGEPAHALIAHALRDRVSLLSNEPGLDPRGSDPTAARRQVGPMLVAPVLIDDDRLEGAEGAFVLFRPAGMAGFTAPDLSLLRSAADLAALAHRLSLVQRRLLTQAELESQLMHLRQETERNDDHQGRLMAAMSHAIAIAQALLRRVDGAPGAAVARQLNLMTKLAEEGQSTDPGLAPPPGRPRALVEIQKEVQENWSEFLEMLGLSFHADPVPEGRAWFGGGPVMEALHGVLDDLFLSLPAGTRIPMRWNPTPGHWSLEFSLPPGAGRVSPDAWSRSILAGAGLTWRWTDGLLSLTFRDVPKLDLTEPERPMLGLVTGDLSLVSLFQGAADAGDLALYPLTEDAPSPPLPVFEVVVVDARGVTDVVACLRSYRAHPTFATTPVLVIRAQESEGSLLLAAGATEWLAGALQWESLHHRLQSLRSHRDLQRKGRASERLETVRQMAGTLKHEINNPLAVISLQTELLQRKFPDEPKLAKISEQVQRIQSLLQVLQKMREPGDEEYPGGTNILKL